MKIISLPVRSEFGVKRTSCNCPDCTINCRHIPGQLLPQDFQPIYNATGKGQPLKEWLLTHFLASPGAILVLVPKSGGQPISTRIPTIVPARKPDGSCIWYDPTKTEGHCTIHGVSPFGCAFFDAHQDEKFGARFSSIAHQYLMQCIEEGSEYVNIWNLLHSNGKVSPPPEESRKRMREEYDKRERLLDLGQPLLP